MNSTNHAPKTPEKPNQDQPAEHPPPKREVDSDVHPQRRPGDPPRPDESDNIPGDENDPKLI